MKTVCPHCKQEFPDTPDECLGMTLECTECGKEFVCVEARNCPACGAASPANASKCAQCGTPLPPAPRPQRPPALSAPPPRAVPPLPGNAPPVARPTRQTRSSYVPNEERDPSRYGEVMSLYSPTGIFWYSFVLGAPFGAWCIWRNYKTLGDSACAKRAFAEFIGYLIALPVLAAFLNWVGSLIVWGIWISQMQRPHSKYLQISGINYDKKSLIGPALAYIGIIVAALFLIGVIIGAME